jgi:hypothetical protein
MSTTVSLYGNSLMHKAIIIRPWDSESLTCRRSVFISLTMRIRVHKTAI